MNISLFKTEQSKDEFVSTFSDPFSSDKCDSITLRIRKNPFEPYDIEYRAIIAFENGATSGDHRITAPDFNTLVKKTEHFLKTL